MSGNQPPTRGAGERPSLTRARVLQTALALTDAQGLAPLSMRSLARALGVGTMSLYTHVSGKDDVIDGMLNLIADEVRDPEGPDWRAALRDAACSWHDALLRHPWAPAVLPTRQSVGPRLLRFYDRILGTLREAGFPPAVARRAFLTLDAHVIGFAQQEATFPPPEESPARARAFRDALPADLPWMREMLHDLLATGDWDLHFTYVLDLILEDLARRRPG